MWCLALWTFPVVTFWSEFMLQGTAWSFSELSREYEFPAPLIIFLVNSWSGSLTASAEASLVPVPLKKSRLFLHCGQMEAGCKEQKCDSPSHMLLFFRKNTSQYIECSDWSLLYGLLLWLKKLGNVLLQARTFSELLGDSACAEQLLPSHNRQEECGCASK